MKFSVEVDTQRLKKPTTELVGVIKWITDENVLEILSIDYPQRNVEIAIMENENTAETTIRRIYGRIGVSFKSLCTLERRIAEHKNTPKDILEDMLKKNSHLVYLSETIKNNPNF